MRIQRRCDGFLRQSDAIYVNAMSSPVAPTSKPPSKARAPRTKQPPSPGKHPAAAAPRDWAAELDEALDKPLPEDGEEAGLFQEERPASELTLVGGGEPRALERMHARSYASARTRASPLPYLRG